MNTVRIGTREVGGNNPVYVIAEAGVNHNGDLELAKKLVDAAHEAGADAVKFQTFTVEEVVTEQAAQAKYQSENTGVSESQAEMLKKLALSPEGFRALKARADEIGIEFLSTPFSVPDVDFLSGLNVAAFKISSGDLTNIPLLEHIAKKGKSVIISTGMATLEEIDQAFETLKKCGARDILIMQCTSEYPSPPAHVNLRVIETFQKRYNVPIGFSDHTLGIEVPIYAASLGAAVIEKHITLDRTLPGPDHRASLEPHELREMIQKIRQTARDSLSVSEEILGSPEKFPTSEEKITAKLVRKGIAARKNILKGDTLTTENIFIARPEGPIAPKEWGAVLGRKAKEDIPRGTSLSWDMLE